MADRLLQRGKQILRLLAGDLEIERIGAKIDFTRPLKSADRSDCDLLENAGLLPDLEYAATGKTVQVRDAGRAIVEPQEQTEAVEWFDFGDLHVGKLHSFKLAVEPSTVGRGIAPALLRRNANT